MPWQLVGERPGPTGCLPVSTHTYVLPDGTTAECAARTQRFVVVARAAKPIAAPQNEVGEFCEVVLITLRAFRAHLRSSQLTDVDLGYLGLDHLGLLGG